MTEMSQDNSLAVAANSTHSTNGFEHRANGHSTPPDMPLPTEFNVQSSTLESTFVPEQQPLPTLEPSAEQHLPPMDSDPAVKQPVSDIRQPTEPAPDDVATEIKESKQQQDLIADQSLANGLAQGGDAPIERSLASEPEPSSTDAMNIDPLPQAAAEPVTENDPNVQESNTRKPIPHHSGPAVADLLMSDAPPTSDVVQPSIEGPSLVPTVSELLPEKRQASEPPAGVQGKVSHPRDDENAESEPASKRVKAEDSAQATPEFKIPDAPAQSGTASTSTSDAPKEGQAAAAAGPAPATRIVNGKVLLERPAERTDTPEFDVEMTKPQQKHLQRGLTNMKKSHHAPPFTTPVDYVALNIPNYPNVVKHPMDLKTMEQKLKEDQYKTVAEYIRDFDQMVTNTVLFNGDAHDVTQHGFHLRMAFDRNLAALPSRDYTEPSAEEKKKAKKAVVPKPPPRRESRSSLGNAKSPTASSPQTTFALGPAGVPLIRRDSTVADGRPKREIHPPAPKDLPYSASKPKRKKFQQELKFCIETLNELKKPKYIQVSGPFQQPVDPVSLNIPNYHKIIKKPIDVSTIEKKLNAGQYENAKEFEADVRLMFSNCYKFNPPDHPVHKMGKEYEKIFDDKWSQKAKWLSDHAPSSEAQSPGSFTEADEDDEDEEEPEEEEEEDGKEDDRIVKLQESIMALSQQLDTLKKGKKKSPPAPAKKLKTGKVTKKEPKKAAPKSGKKAPGKRGGQKVPIMSYDEKRSISDRINELHETKIPQVLQIIRDNMPNLKVRLLRSTFHPARFSAVIVVG